MQEIYNGGASIREEGGGGSSSSSPNTIPKGGLRWEPPPQAKHSALGEAHRTSKGAPGGLGAAATASATLGLAQLGPMQLKEAGGILPSIYRTEKLR